MTINVIVAVSDNGVIGEFNMDKDLKELETERLRLIERIKDIDFEINKRHRNVGYHIHKARKKIGITLDELSDLVKSSKSYVWEVENNRMNPSFDKMILFADALGLSLDRLAELLKGDAL
jgi:ribosome-binding protein aMBF1 (putative translation factor)